MIHRPADAAGDVLPVLSLSSLLNGAQAVAELVRERLDLLAGAGLREAAALLTVFLLLNIGDLGVKE